MDEADRLHTWLCDAMARLVGLIDGGSWCSYGTYAVAKCPAVPIPGANGLWDHGVGDASAAAALPGLVEEFEKEGLPFWALLREGRSVEVEDLARGHGLVQESEELGMVATPASFRPPEQVPGTLVERVDGSDVGLGEALGVMSEGFDVPRELFAPLYRPPLVQAAGIRVYVARHGGETVATAIAFGGGDDVGIYNVATTPAHRRRGFGGAVTGHALVEAFDQGASFAYLQSSSMGASLYRRLGFRAVDSYLVFHRSHDDRSPV